MHFRFYISAAMTAVKFAMILTFMLVIEQRVSGGVSFIKDVLGPRKLLSFVKTLEM